MYVRSYLITRKLQSSGRLVRNTRRNNDVVPTREVIPDGAQTGTAVQTFQEGLVAQVALVLDVAE